MDSSGFTWEQVGEARAALEEFRASVSECVNENGIVPVSNSPARQERDRFRHPESVDTVYSQALLLIEVAADQLTAFLKTTEPPFETIAPWTCARALLDAAALGSWLLEPGLSASERVRRSVALRYEELQQQRKHLASIGEDADPTVARIETVVQHALTLGFQPVQDRKGRHIGAGVRMPSSTQLVGLQLDEEAMYRLLSAVAHGHSWAIRQLGFRILPADSGLTEDVDGPRLMTKAASPLGYMYLALGCAEGFGKVTWFQCLYAGWYESPVNRMLERLFDRIGAKDRVRFWHR